MLQRAMAKLHLGVGTWLALVSLAALLPMLALLVLSTGKLILEQQAREAESLARRAAVAADHLASELTLRRRLLETLADSDAARTGDLASLRRQAARVVAGDGLLRSISLTDAQGQQRLNTLQAAGMPLPVTRQQALEQPVFLQGQALVSPLVQGTLSGEWLLGIAVPVRGPDGQVRYALRASLQPAAVNQVLERQRWPASWTASVIDQRGAIVARSREPARFVGQLATLSVRALIATGGPSSGDAVTKDRQRVLAAVAPVGSTGWFVAVGKPADPLAAQLREALLVVGGVGGLLVAAGAATSFILGRRVAQAVRAVALGEAGSTSPVKELAHIHGRLDAAATATQRAQDALHGARHDALTGLAGRGLFLEQLASLAGGLPAAHGLALLFIDLDGFKGINDRLGHEAGDRALASVAKVLLGQLRTGDQVGRLGGDEFVVALAGPVASLQATGEGVALRVIDGVARQGQGLGCSIGLALAASGEAPDAVLQRADHAMLRAKQAGKNRLVLA